MRAGAPVGTSLFPLVIAGLLAGLTWWLAVASRPGGIPDDGRARPDPDYFVENFEVRRYGPDGVLQHTLRAERLTHYPADDSSVVLAPDLTWHRVPLTRVTAREGRVDGEGEHVELLGDVQVTRGATRGKDATVLTTSRLDVWPDKEVAANREPVTIVQGKSEVHGSGLHADNKISTYVLEGPVRGIFHRSSVQ